ncbi:SafA/ExsA family spore coat assembly protein [Brevibacillus fluminis]|uniref:SafA/ExsA family spore coat assembly protein n=1 Tax=Brevibacillus fluminis TaxID=511487 RepID=UPI003F88DFE7
MKIHIVQKGDTMWKIARRYGVDFKELLRANSQLKNPDLIYPGMKIKVPSGRVPARPHHHSDSGMGSVKERPHKEAPIKEAPIVPPPAVEEEEVPPSVETRPYESPEQPAPPPPPAPQIQQAPTPPAPIPAPAPTPAPAPAPAPVVPPPPAPQIKVAPPPAPPVVPQPTPQIRPFIKQQPVMPFSPMPNPPVSPFMQPRPMMPPVTIMPLPPMPMPMHPQLPLPQPQLPIPQMQPQLPIPQPQLPIPQMQPRPYCPPCHAQRYPMMPMQQEPICPPALMPKREAPWEMEDSCESPVRRMPRSSDETSETVLYHHHRHHAIPESYDNPYMRGYTGGHPSSSTHRSNRNSSMYPAPQLMPPMPGHEVWPRWEKGFEESSSLHCTD